MSEEVVQWLAEIRALRQQLVQAQDEGRAAQESAAHWRKLYNIEARQRRTETQTLREEIERLQAELQRWQAGPPADSDREAALAAELAHLDAPERLKQKLIAALQERDRALEALKLEQENHVNTRKNLTAVIGDTIDQLARVRAAQGQNGSPPPVADAPPQDRAGNARPSTPHPEPTDAVAAAESA